MVKTIEIKGGCLDCHLEVTSYPPQILPFSQISPCLPRQSWKLYYGDCIKDSLFLLSNSQGYARGYILPSAIL